jgi:hypothetical protein
MDMTDEYFKKKAEKIRNKIYDSRVDNKKLTFEDIDKIIDLNLKEVARDQRYASIAEVEIEMNDFNLTNQCKNRIIGVIHNS